MKQKNLKVFIGVLSFQIALLALSQNAFATNAKVVKAKGKRVLVEFPVDPRLQAGDTVGIDTLELRSPASARANAGARAFTFGGSGELHFYSQSNGYPGDTYFNLVGRGGWNTLTFEYGPLGSLSYQASNSNTSTTTFGAGGFLDFNLVPNTPGTSDVYGIGGDAQLTTANIKVAGVTTSSSGIALNGGGFFKYFLFRTDTCLRFDAQLHVATNNNYTETGLRFLGGLQSYF